MFLIYQHVIPYGLYTKVWYAWKRAKGETPDLINYIMYVLENFDNMKIEKLEIRNNISLFLQQMMNWKIYVFCKWEILLWCIMLWDHHSPDYHLNSRSSQSSEYHDLWYALMKIIAYINLYWHLCLTCHQLMRDNKNVVHFVRLQSIET